MMSPVTCPICLSPSPAVAVLVPCGHSLCVDCLDNMRKRVRASRFPRYPGFACPECRTFATQFVVPRFQFDGVAAEHAADCERARAYYAKEMPTPHLAPVNTRRSQG